MEMPAEWKRAPDRPRASAEREAVSREAESRIWHQRSHSSYVEYRFSASVSRRDDSFAFFHRIDAVDGGNRDLFFCTARPVNLHPVHFRCRPKAEMQALVGTRCIAPAAEELSALARASCRDKYLGANRITGTLGTSQQPERDPVIRILNDVA